QAYLDRLHHLMRNLQMDEGYFVTLSDFAPECYEFIANKRIELMNGSELVESLLEHTDM
ncbi:MAG TPA: restriction endonuclease, partial [Firmicutes bacterium]|nr:restriction endonuclease [Bacillota bacterium]